MKQFIKKISGTLLAAVLFAPAGLLAQNTEVKDKEQKEKKEAEQIIITRKGSKEEKMVVEVNGDKILVNGKEIKDSDGDITVHRSKIKDVWAYGGNYNFNGNQSFSRISIDENRAMLGVTTEKAENGVEIQEITKESAAEKAGLKKGDVITKINESKIEDPDDLSAVIKKQKPGDKVTVTYLRDKKQQNVTAELTKWKGVSAYTFPGGQEFKMDMKDFDFDMEHPSPRAYSTPMVRGYATNRGPKLGISVQDAEDGKGVKVLDIDDEGSGAKAGIKENDVITEVDGKTVNSADEIAKIVRESKDKASIKMKLLRAGKVQTVDVKIPRKLKTADL